MPYDVELADRLRAALEGRPVTEKRMFGGLGLLVEGHLAVAASGQGGLMVRVRPERTAILLQEPGAQRFVMRGKEVEGWLHVTGPLDDDALRRWVEEALDRVEELDPPHSSA